MGKGSDIRPFYEKTPMLNFRIHLFNVTNKDDVIQGSKSIGSSLIELKKVIAIIRFYLFLKKNRNFKRLDRISSSE